MQTNLIGRVLFYALSAFIGVIFIYGAYAKLLNIEPFEWSLAETGIFSFTTANIFTRIFIAFEFVIGLLFIGAISLQGRAYTLAAILLILFNIYLLWIVLTYGNNGNCGCFGESLKMLPMQAYLKNLAMLLGIYILSKWQHAFASTYAKWQVITLSILAMGYTLFMQAPDFIYIKEKESVKPHSINLDVMYSTDASAHPTFDYKKGKHIISVLSTGCVFCKKAARKMHTMKARNIHLPLYNIIMGDSLSTQLFLKETLANNIPYQVNENVPYLYKLTNNRLPCILWITDGQVVRMSNYFSLNQTDIENWIKK